MDHELHTDPERSRHTRMRDRVLDHIETISDVQTQVMSIDTEVSMHSYTCATTFTCTSCM